MTEEQYGRLTLIRVLPERTRDKHIVGLWHCACGAEKAIALSRVRNGYSQSCGCLGPEVSRVRNKTHGMRQSSEYRSWGAMVGRCTNPNHKDYPKYGAMGISICAEWRGSFEAFFAAIGPRPLGTTIDRIDNRRGYEPGNVRWATASEQQRNRTSAYQWHIKGVDFETHTEAAQQFGVSEHTVWRWVHGQFDKRRNSFTPPRKDCHVTPRY